VDEIIETMRTTIHRLAGIRKIAVGKIRSNAHFRILDKLPEDQPCTRRIAAEIGIAYEIHSKLRANPQIIGATRELHIAPTLEARTIAELRVAEIISPIVLAEGFTAGRGIVVADAFGNGTKACGFRADSAERHQQHAAIGKTAMPQSRDHERQIGD